MKWTESPRTTEAWTRTELKSPRSYRGTEPNELNPNRSEKSLTVMLGHWKVSGRNIGALESPWHWAGAENERISGRDVDGTRRIGCRMLRFLAREHMPNGSDEACRLEARLQSDMIVTSWCYRLKDLARRVVFSSGSYVLICFFFILAMLTGFLLLIVDMDAQWEY
jgi:hypothetical protein